MKRLTAILLAALMIIAMTAGCGKRPEPEATPEPSSSEPESIAPGVPATKEQAAANNARLNTSAARTIQFTELDDGDPIAVLETSMGTIKIRLFPEQAPKTVEAFEKLIESGYYNGQQFGEIVPGYKIECAETQGEGVSFPEEPEFSLDLWNFRGAVSLSNNGADFMIVQAARCLNPREELEAINFPQNVIDKYVDEGGAPHQDWKNPVFGMVIEGMSVVDAITSVKTGEDGKPEEPVVISGSSLEFYHDGDSGEAESEGEASA